MTKEKNIYLSLDCNPTGVTTIEGTIVRFDITLRSGFELAYPELQVYKDNFPSLNTREIKSDGMFQYDSRFEYIRLGLDTVKEKRGTRVLVKLDSCMGIVLARLAEQLDIHLQSNELNKLYDIDFVKFGKGVFKSEETLSDSYNVSLMDLFTKYTWCAKLFTEIIRLAQLKRMELKDLLAKMLRDELTNLKNDLLSSVSGKVDRTVVKGIGKTSFIIDFPIHDTLDLTLSYKGFSFPAEYVEMPRCAVTHHQLGIFKIIDNIRKQKILQEAK